ncbi:Ig domain-containing protein, partial [Tropheryma whipplei]|uniref:Ig domain-containing protein n=2 Tax=Tropheryma whipplei TaxID=2039 RepID=UPI0005AB8FF3
YAIDTHNPTTSHRSKREMQDRQIKNPHVNRSPLKVQDRALINTSLDKWCSELTICNGGNEPIIRYYGYLMLTPNISNITTTVSVNQSTITISPSWSIPGKIIRTSTDSHGWLHGTGFAKSYATPTSFLINTSNVITNGMNSMFSLPSGLTLNTTNGAITGSIDSSVTPGLYQFVVTAFFGKTLSYVNPFFGKNWTYTFTLSDSYTTATYQIYVTYRESNSLYITLIQGQNLSLTAPFPSRYAMTLLHTAGSLPSGLNLVSRSITGIVAGPPGVYEYVVTYARTATIGQYSKHGTSSTNVFLKGICNTCSRKTAIFEHMPKDVYTTLSTVITPELAVVTYIFTVLGQLKTNTVHTYASLGAKRVSISLPVPPFFLLFSQYTYTTLTSPGSGLPKGLTLDRYRKYITGSINPSITQGVYIAYITALAVFTIAVDAVYITVYNTDISTTSIKTSVLIGQSSVYIPLPSSSFYTLSVTETDRTEPGVGLPSGLFIDTAVGVVRGQVNRNVRPGLYTVNISLDVFKIRKKDTLFIYVLPYTPL